MTSLIRFLVFFLFPFSVTLTAGAAEKPNIIIILADDLGYSDIGCYGSEIATPHLDSLAADGLRMTRFYNAAKCCPSRAALLTGLHPHQAGIGLMTDQEIDMPSYQGYFKEDAATIAQLLKTADYDTYTTGKWHVGEEPEHWPRNYGFDRCLSFVTGASSYFDNGPYRNEDWPWDDGVFSVLDDDIFEYPKGTYATNLYTDYALKFIDESLERNRPFFLYLAYTAPHWPLHALPEDIEKYEGRYDNGWDSLRRERFRRQNEIGLFPIGTKLSDPDEKVRDWGALNPRDKQLMADKMEVYAAMIDRMDQNIGRLIVTLKEKGEFDNTFIVFLSDNGAASAGGVPFLHERFSKEAPVGSDRSFTAYGREWATASNTPFRLYKSQVQEGGIRTPFIAHYPRYITPSRLDHTTGHITDILMTCIDLAGVEYPETVEGKPIQSPAGVSLVPLFKGKPIHRTEPLVFEHLGNKAIIDGSWKLVTLNGQPWELYDLDNDPTEMINLIQSASPEAIGDLLYQYHRWAKQVGALPRDIVEKRTIRN